jgi:hypothetical protein
MFGISIAEEVADASLALHLASAIKSLELTP